MLGDWLVDPRGCHLSRGETSIKLRAQLVDVLVCLARRSGRIVLKNEIFAEVWPGQYIAESGLSRCIAELRQILQDDAQHPRYIETITKRGYRLVAAVVWLEPPGDLDQQTLATEDATLPQEAAGAPVTPAADTEPPGRGHHDRPALRTVWIAAGVLLLAIAGVTVVLLKRAPASVFLTERDPVLLAFENRTGDKVFDDTIPLAVSIQLEQSPYLSLLPPLRAQEALQMMKRPPDTAITRAVGLEICERLGGRATIVTSISRLGTQYVIGLEAVACGAGTVLARQQATTERKEQVLDALQRAAGAIRLAVGESVASLQRYQLPIVEATTVSLDALRAVRLGDMARERGEMDQALGLYREAVTLDPDFPLAQSRLGLMAIGDERVEALRKAYASRQRVTFPERLEIEASYHRNVTGEKAPVVEALELLSRSYPRRAVARRDLALEYMSSGRYEAALPEAREAVRLEPTSALNLAALARAHLFLDQIAEARRAAEQGIALGGTAPDLHIALFYCGLASNDATVLARERAWAAGHPEVPALLENEAELSLDGGRLREAIGFLRKYEAWGAQASAADRAHVDTARTRLVMGAGLPMTSSVADMPARMRLRLARYEALCGLSAQATRHIEAELRHDLGAVAKMDAVRAAVSAGRFDMAERLLGEIGGEGPRGEWVATMARTYRAAIAARRGNTDEALEVLAPIRPFELGFSYSLEPLFERARTHYLAGDWTSAREAFEKILAHPTIDSGRKLQFATRLGLARTLARVGDVAGSRRAYEQFLERWRNADVDLPVLLDARREYATLPR